MLSTDSTVSACLGTLAKTVNVKLITVVQIHVGMVDHVLTESTAINARVQQDLPVLNVKTALTHVICGLVVTGSVSIHQLVAITVSASPASQAGTASKQSTTVHEILAVEMASV